VDGARDAGNGGPGPHDRGATTIQTSAASRVLLSVTLGVRESYEDWQALGRDPIARGLGAPMLIVADGAPGLIKAIEQCWTAPDRQRCRVPARATSTPKCPRRT